jgi:hypothetical protein
MKGRRLESIVAESVRANLTVNLHSRSVNGAAARSTEVPGDTFDRQGRPTAKHKRRPVEVALESANVDSSFRSATTRNDRQLLKRDFAGEHTGDHSYVLYALVDNLLFLTLVAILRRAVSRASLWSKYCPDISMRSWKT